MQTRPFQKYRTNETPITAPIIKKSLDAEVTIGFRLPGNKDKDVLLADLVGKMLTNGRAGLMDLD
jgi:hypothetical protein